MLSSIAIVLGYQVVGELISRLTGIPVPGPVIGMVLMLLSFLVKDNLIGIVRPTRAYCSQTSRCFSCRQASASCATASAFSMKASASW